MFNVSTPPFVPEDALSFAVPMNKFTRMIENMPESFLTTKSWGKPDRRIKKGANKWIVRRTMAPSAQKNNPPPRWIAGLFYEQGSYTSSRAKNASHISQDFFTSSPNVVRFDLGKRPEPGEPF
jgi:hypothetical protein